MAKKKASKKSKRGPGRPPIYSFNTMKKGETRAFDLNKHPSVAQAAYQYGKRVKKEFTTHRIGGGQIEIKRAA
jgi:hypothetical protein